MANAPITSVLDRLQRTAVLSGADRRSDAELLAAFIASGSEAAFAGLFRRHEAMVYGVCRRILGNTHDAEDAFQAAFLVLARKAASVQPPAFLSPWLHGVAYRTALKARSMMRKRNAREKQTLQVPEPAAPVSAPWSDVEPLIDQELNRLAEKYRLPVILCDVEGQSQRAAAKHLAWPEGTLMTRLARGRRLLARRLARRDVTLGGALAPLLAQHAARASVPAALAAATVKAAPLVAAGQAVTGLVSAQAAALTSGVLRMMFLAKIKSVAIFLCVALVLCGGIVSRGRQADHLTAAEPPLPLSENAFAGFVAQERGGRKAPDSNAPNLRGKIVSVAKDGKACTVETPSTMRGEEPIKHAIKVDDKTELKFFGVGLDGAKLTEDMVAQVWTREDAKDVAAKIQLGNARENLLGPNFSGKVTDISKEGDTLRLELGGRGESGKTVEIKFNLWTARSYSNVVQGGAKPTTGYTADVWLKRGSKTEAAAISFRGGSRDTDGRRAERGGIHGTLVAIGKEGKLITVETPPQERGGKSKRTDVIIDDKTSVVFNNIRPDGDKLAEGYAAHVMLREGSKDTAASVSLSPNKGSSHELFKSVRGKIAEVAKGGKSFTIELPAERAQPAEKRTIKITHHTRVIFNAIGPGGARLTEGHGAMVYLDEGSLDTAFLVIFAPDEAARR